MLELKKASLKISNRFVIGPLTAQINKGSAVAIIGESGCGKTTFLQMIYGLYDLNSGTIFWNTTQVTGPEENLVPGMPFIKYLFIFILKAVVYFLINPINIEYIYSK